MLAVIKREKVPISRHFLETTILSEYAHHSGRIPISAVIGACTEQSVVYCGKACPELQEICDRKSLTLVDYFEREELTVVNAAITAFIISLSTPQTRFPSDFAGSDFYLCHRTS
jgi:hypothetical protein